MKVLSLDQAGIFAWSNSKKNKSLFATASIYDSFSSSHDTQDDATLQIYSLDIVNKTSTSQKLGTAKIDGLQFTSLNWSAFGDDEKYPYGLIASGFNDGTVGLWDVNYIVQNSGSDSTDDVNHRGLLCLQMVHSSPVKAVAFNPVKRHLVASGGTEVAIHNLEKDIADPDVFSPGDNLHEESAITAVSWNRHVPHILGSASQNGVSVVWDLKINKPIFNFSDHNRGASNRNVCLSWSPEIATQFAVAYEDEKTPEFQIWDLRNSKGPIYCSLKGHNKGIHYLDWCLTDPALIITLGRDNKVCIWNYKTGDSNNLVSESGLDEPCSTVQWSPRQPEIYSVTSVAGSSTIYSLNDQIDHIPIWLRPPVGARFSFDGRLASFSEKSGGRVHEYDVSPEEDELMPYIVDFEQNFLTPDVDILNLCESRIYSKYLDEKEKEEWKFIKAIVSDNPDEIIKVVGLDKDKAIKQAEDYTSKTYIKSTASNAQKNWDHGLRAPSQQDAEDFFNFLGEQGSKPAEAQKNEVKAKDGDGEVMVTETVTKNTNWKAGAEKVIKENILVGNIEGAVDSALKCGRVAEAFLLAYSKGEHFFRTTIESYVTSCNDPFVKNVIRYLVEDEISELVKKYPLEDWKECIALCVSLSKGVDSVFREHMEELALRFSKTGDHNKALLCNILSKNFTRVLETFAFRTESYQKGSFEHTVFLIRTIEKLVALRILTGNLEPNPIVDRFIYELNKVLYTYKRDTLILNLLTINSSTGFECLILKDRILSSYQEYSRVYNHQQFPFRLETVNIKHKPKPVHTQQPGNLNPHQQGVQNQSARPGQNIPQQQTQPQNQLPGLTQKPTGRPAGFKPGVPVQGHGGPPGIQNQSPESAMGMMPRPEQKTFPPPVGGLGGPKSNPVPFVPGQGGTSTMQGPPGGKEALHTPPPMGKSTSATSSQGPFGDQGKGGLDWPSQNLSASMSESSKMGLKSSPFSGTQSTHASHSFAQDTIPDPSPTTFKPQPRPGPPTRPQPQPPTFKGQTMPTMPNMPKGVGGPIQPSQTGPGPISSVPTTSLTHSLSSDSSAPPFGGSTVNPPQGPGSLGGPPKGLAGGPPVRPGPPKMGAPGNPPVVSAPSTISQGQSGGNQMVGPPPTGGLVTGGPPLGGPGQVKSQQGFKPPPQAVPGRGPVKMPPPGGNMKSGEIQQVDPMGLPNEARLIYEALQREMEVLEQIDKDPRRKVEVHNKMNGLFKMLAEGRLKSGTLQDLYWLCESLNQGNYDSALALQQKIAKEDFDGSKEWIMTVRRVIQKK